MNLVQGTYAFLMGMLLAYGYEYFGEFKIPVLIHVMSNVLAYCLTYTGVAMSGFISWPVCIVFLAMAIIALLQLKKQKSVF